MNILTICQFYYPENFSITPLMRELVAIGHQVTVITGRPNAGFGQILPEYRQTKFEIIDGVKVHRLPIVARKQSKISLIINYFSFYFLGRHFVRHHHGDYDVVFAMSLSPVISLVPAVKYAKKHKLPLILYCVDIWPESVVFTNQIGRDTLGFKLLKHWSKQIYQSADRLLVGSPSYRQYMNEEHGISGDKIFTLVQPAITETSSGPAIDFKEGHHIVYIGNLGQVQLIEELLEAFLMFGETDLHLHLIGQGSRYLHIKAFVNEHHLENRIHLYGTLASEVAATYGPNADALLLPLKQDGYVGKTIPNKLMMYLQYARPIIGALKGDGRDILNQAGGGILVDPTKDGLIEGIQAVLSMSEQEKSALGARNLAYFKEHHTLTKVVKELVHHLNDIKN